MSRQHRIDGSTRLKSCQGGFTLLELLVVCALIGMLLMTGVPAFRDAVINDTLRSDSRKLIGYINVVRDKGLREQRSYLLIFDLAENRVYHRPEEENASGETPEDEKKILRFSDNVSIRDLWTKSDGTLDSGQVELWVSRQGYLDRSVIHLENDDGEGISLLISSFLPDVEVRDGYYEPEM